MNVGALWNFVFLVGRLEEREVELKKEYNSLHQRHTEVRRHRGDKKNETFRSHSSAAPPYWFPVVFLV